MEFFIVLDRAVMLSQNGRYDTRLAKKLSKTIRDTPEYSQEDARMWVKYWLKHGLTDFSE
jgi:hypothetical protein